MRNGHHNIGNKIGWSKKPFVLLLFLFFSFGYSQAIKIYVTDAETGKNISKAKVCLEGFEIPAIAMKYNKKGKYYYTNEIPANYNTVMVYHKEYNEKGFQNVDGLPKELSVKLHKPLYNYYDFIDKKERYSDQFPHVFFVEDPYKIVIRSSSNISYKEFKDKLFAYIKENNIEIESINPFREFHHRSRKDTIANAKYNKICSEDIDRFTSCIYPFVFGSDNQDGCRKSMMDTFDTSRVAIFFRKKDKTKFKRYNDEIIEKIEKSQEFRIYPVLYYKENIMEDNLESKKINKSNPYKERDRANKKFNQKNRIDSSAIYFYSNEYPLYKINKKHMGYADEEPNKGCVKHFKLIEKNNCNPIYITDNLDESFCLFRDEKTDENKLNSLNFNKYHGLGLGILDIYEYYNSIFKK